RRGNSREKTKLPRRTRSNTKEQIHSTFGLRAVSILFSDNVFLHEPSCPSWLFRAPLGWESSRLLGRSLGLPAAQQPPIIRREREWRRKGLRLRVLRLRKITRLSRPAALYTRHSCYWISRQAFHHASVLGFRLARGNQSQVQIPSRSRRQRALGGIRSAHTDGLRLRPFR